MSFVELGLGLTVALLFTIVVYATIGIDKIKQCYRMWFDRSYWTDYNITEAAAWLTKAVIIVPGLIFGIEIWQFYILALVTSMALIWSSNRKLLPTLVGFNTLWIFISCLVIAKNLI